MHRRGPCLERRGGSGPFPACQAVSPPKKGVQPGGVTRRMTPFACVPGGGVSNPTQDRGRSDTGVTIGRAVGGVMVMLSLLFRDDLGGLSNLVLIWGTLLAIFLALWRSMVAERQVKVAQEGLRADRYQRAVEMTGHELASSRMGGIQGLRELAFDHSNAYRWKVLNFLSAHAMGTGKDVTFRPVDKDGKPIGEYLVNEPPDEWMTREVIRDILVHKGGISQEKSADRWGGRLLFWLKNLCKRSQHTSAATSIQR